MIEKLRYVIRRVGRRGNVRWYWARKGHPLTRLPDDLAGRVAKAQVHGFHACGVFGLLGRRQLPERKLGEPQELLKHGRAAGRAPGRLGCPAACC